METALPSEPNRLFSEILHAIQRLREIPTDSPPELCYNFDIPQPLLDFHQAFGAHLESDSGLFQQQDHVYSPSSLFLASEMNWALEAGVSPNKIVFAQENQAAWIAVVDAISLDPPASVILPDWGNSPLEQREYPKLSILLSGLILEVTHWKLPKRWSVKAPFSEQLWLERGFKPLLASWQPVSETYQDAYWWREHDMVLLTYNNQLELSQLSSLRTKDIDILWCQNEQAEQAGVGNHMPRC